MISLWLQAEELSDFLTLPSAWPSAQKHLKFKNILSPGPRNGTALQIALSKRMAFRYIWFHGKHERQMRNTPPRPTRFQTLVMGTRSRTLRGEKIKQKNVLAHVK